MRDDGTEPSQADSADANVGDGALRPAPSQPDDSTETASIRPAGVSARRTARQDMHREPTKVRVVASGSVEARREEQRTRCLATGEGLPTAPTTPIQRCSRTDGSLFLLFCEGVDQKLREARDSAVKSHRECADEYAEIRRHLGLHKRSSQPVARPDGFRRLKVRLRTQGYMTYAWPGPQRMWRRAFGVGVIVLLLVIFSLLTSTSASGFEVAAQRALVGTLTVVDTNLQPVRPTKPLVSDEVAIVSEGSGRLWMPTPTRGAATQLMLREGSRFRIPKPGYLQFDAGEVSLVTVTSEAAAHDPFVVSTARAEVSTGGAVFGVEADELSTTVYVYEGWVTLRGLASGKTTLVTEGHGAQVVGAEPMLDPFPLVEISISSYPGRQILVAMKNRAARRLSISKAFGPEPGAYVLRIDQDTVGADGSVPMGAEFKLTPIPGHPGSRGFGAGFERHFDRALLDPMGRGQHSYQFAADLGPMLLGNRPSHYTLSIQYRGTVEVEGIGSVALKPTSIPIRYDSTEGEAAPADR